MCNIKDMRSSRRPPVWLAAWLGLVVLTPSCKSGGQSPPSQGPSLPLDRIAIVGASVSAGFGGTPFGEAFSAAATQSKVDTAANVMLFRDPIGDTQRQLDQAVAFKASTIVALDLLFWDVYGSRDPAWHDQALTTALDRLEQARAAGAWIVIGDVPLITTANEMMLPKEAVPAAAALDAANQRIRAWAARERVLLVPLGEWTAPLRAGQDVTLPGGEKKPAAELMSIDGLHANALGTWYLLDKLDHYIEAQLPGTPKDALVFERPQS